MQRICKKCNQEKSLEDFVKAKQCLLGRSWTCRECNWEIRAPEYKKQRKHRADYENKKNRKRKEDLVDLFGNKCFDCGVSYPPYIFDFHHLDPSIKDFKPSSLRRVDLIQSELAKCVMLCANCHRERHWAPKEGSRA